MLEGREREREREREKAQEREMLGGIEKGRVSEWRERERDR